MSDTLSDAAGQGDISQHRAAFVAAATEDFRAVLGGVMFDRDTLGGIDVDRLNLCIRAVDACIQNERRRREFVTVVDSLLPAQVNAVPIPIDLTCGADAVLFQRSPGIAVHDGDTLHFRVEPDASLRSADVVLVDDSADAPRSDAVPSPADPSPEGMVAATPKEPEALGARVDSSTSEAELLPDFVIVLLADGVEAKVVSKEAVWILQQLEALPDGSEVTRSMMIEKGFKNLRNRSDSGHWQAFVNAMGALRVLGVVQASGERSTRVYTKCSFTVVSSGMKQRASRSDATRLKNTAPKVLAVEDAASVDLGSDRRVFYTPEVAAEGDHDSSAIAQELPSLDAEPNEHFGTIDFSYESGNKIVLHRGVKVCGLNTIAVAVIAALIEEGDYVDFESLAELVKSESGITRLTASSMRRAVELAANTINALDQNRLVDVSHGIGGERTRYIGLRRLSQVPQKTVEVLDESGQFDAAIVKTNELLRAANSTIELRTDDDGKLTLVICDRGRSPQNTKLPNVKLIEVQFLGVIAKSRKRSYMSLQDIMNDLGAGAADPNKFLNDIRPLLNRLVQNGAARVNGRNTQTHIRLL